MENQKIYRRVDLLAAYVARIPKYVWIISGIFALILIPLMSDFMRQNRQQNKLAMALSQAVKLAAVPDLTQTAQQAVAQVMAQSNLKNPYYLSVSVDDKVDLRRISAQASSRVETKFLRYLWIDKLDIYATAKSEEKIPVTEVVLVLDVSQSMNENDRLADLKEASKDFVRRVLDSGVNQNVLVSVVPFAGSVAVPNEVLSALQVSGFRPVGGCVEFAQDDFATTRISPDQGLTPVVQAARYGAAWQDLSPQWRSCDFEYSQQALMFAQDSQEIAQRIDRLTAAGGSANHVAMKWAAGILNAGFQAASQDFIGARPVQPGGTVTSPVDFDDTSDNAALHRKIIVMISDGSPSAERRFSAAFSGDNAPVWRRVAPARQWKNGAYKGIIQNDGNWWSLSAGFEWMCDRADFRDDYTCQYQQGRFVQADTHFIEKDGRFLGVQSKAWVSQLPKVPMERLNWDQVWGLMSIEYFESIVGAGAAQDWLQTGAKDQTQTANEFIEICAAAKDRGIKVITVGFETGAATSDLFSECATLPGDFYPTSQVGLSTTMNSIATEYFKSAYSF